MDNQSMEERLQAARKRVEELKKRNKLPSSRSSFETAAPPATVSSDETNQLKEQIKELNSVIEQQRSTIKKLRGENTDLKLEKIDLNDKIAELQDELQRAGPSAGSKETTELKSNSLKDSTAENIEKTTVQSEKVLPKPQIQSQTGTGDFRERLMQWKGWQVDMREWGDNTAQVAL